MTLCVSWIRQIGDSEELIFATDSTLTGGEKWEGIKLFELSRDGCLLCFAGNTMRAYPLILNLVSSIKLNRYLQSGESTLYEVIDYISNLFTELSYKIVDEIKDTKYDIHKMRAEAKFLFGGWDWNSGKFRVWKLYYSRDAEGFLFDDLTDDDSKTRFYTFLGDAQIDIEKNAKERFLVLLTKEEKEDSKLDMEPLSILRDIALDPSIREVGGSLQIAKIFKSNKTEFFGLLWPSSKGNPHFHGREYDNFSKPNVRYLNPDTFEIIDIDLPQNMTLIDDPISGINKDFVSYCYPDGNLKDNLTGKEKRKLKSLLIEVAYYRFLKLVNDEGKTVTENDQQQ